MHVWCAGGERMQAAPVDTHVYMLCSPMSAQQYLHYTPPTHKTKPLRWTCAASWLRGDTLTCHITQQVGIWGVRGANKKRVAVCAGVCLLLIVLLSMLNCAAAPPALSYVLC